MHSSGHHHEPIPALPTHQEVTRDVLARFTQVGSGYKVWVALLALLVSLGVAGVIIRIAGGFDDRTNWGYHVATLAFLITTFAAAPLISAGLRLIKANWRRPITRITEIYGLTGLVALLMLLPALAALPPLEGRADIWMDWPMGAPSTWDIIALAILSLTGISFLWLLAIPDLAAARDHMPPSGRRDLISKLSLGWTGYSRQWRIHRLGALILGGIYLLTYPLIQTLITSDFSAGLIPGLKDAIYPAFMTLAGLQGGVGIVLVTMFILRRSGGYANYISMDQFWSLSKPLLAFSLLWFYFWWSSFITFWYGKMPSEVSVIQLLFLEPYREVFIASLFLNFLGPLLALMWSPVRKSVWGPSLVGLGVVIGAFLNMIRLYVSAFSIENVNGHLLETVPGGQWPEAPDILIAIGGIAAPVLLFFLVSKVVPVISIWEVAEGLKLTKVRTLLGRQVRVIAKSH